MDLGPIGSGAAFEEESGTGGVRTWRAISPDPGVRKPSFRALLALLCAALLVPGEGALLAQAPPSTAAAPAGGAPAPAKLPPDKLDSLVAPVALYPDDLLAQTLVAATYPLELMQLQQWLAKNKSLKDKALADAVAKQPWDPSIQSMAPLPDVVKRLCDDIQWTTDLGNAFLDQQKDVMDAVQRMRKKAQEKGALKTNEQQKVETKVVETQTVIVVQPSNPEVIYVPVYSPTVVYPPPVYPYPPIYYPPPPPPGAAFMTFTAGVMIGAAVWGGSCCGCGWGSNNTVNVNVNNNVQQEHERQERQRAAQLRAPRRRSVFEQRDGKQVRRVDEGRRGRAPAERRGEPERQQREPRGWRRGEPERQHRKPWWLRWSEPERQHREPRRRRRSEPERQQRGRLEGRRRPRRRLGRLQRQQREVEQLARRLEHELRLPRRRRKKRRGAEVRK